jgi:hypothetical protein
MNSLSKVFSCRALGAAVACLLLSVISAMAREQNVDHAPRLLDREAPPVERDLTLEELFPGLTLRADVNETESNNTCATANGYTQLDVFHGSISSSADLDFVSFTVTAVGQEIIIGTGADPNSLNDVDLIISLYGPTDATCTTVLASDDNSGPGAYAAITDFIATQTGLYKVKIDGVGTDAGDYLFVAESRVPLEPDMCLTTLYDSEKRSVGVEVNPNGLTDVEFITDPIIFTPRIGFAIDDVIIDLDLADEFASDLDIELIHTTPSGTETRVLLFHGPECGEGDDFIHDGFTKYYFASNERVNDIPRFLAPLYEECPVSSEFRRGCYAASPSSADGLDDLRGLPFDDSAWELRIFDRLDDDNTVLHNWSVHLLVSSQTELCPLDNPEAFPGEEIDISLELRNYHGLFDSNQFEVQFDPNVLDFKEGVPAGITAAGWSIATNVIMGNTVVVQLGNPGGPVDLIPDTQILMKLKFNVKATAPEGPSEICTLTASMQGALTGVNGCCGTCTVVGCLRDGDINLSRTCDFSDYGCIFKCALRTSLDMPPECQFHATGCETIAADLDGDGHCDIEEALWMALRCLCGSPPLHEGICQPGLGCNPANTPWDKPVNRPCPGGFTGSPAPGHEWLIRIEDSQLGTPTGHVGFWFYDPTLTTVDPDNCTTGFPAQGVITGRIDETVAIPLAGKNALTLAQALADEINGTFPTGWKALVYDPPFDFDPNTLAIIDGFPHLQIRSPAPYELGRVECAVFSNEIGGSMGSFHGLNLNERHGGCGAVSNLGDGDNTNQRQPYVAGFGLSVDEGYWCAWAGWAVQSAPTGRRWDRARAGRARRDGECASHSGCGGESG